MVACFRDESYIERSEKALAECATYEKKPNGAFGATQGHHDDRVMTRAIGLYICFCEMELPCEITDKNKAKQKHPINEATI